MCVCVCVRRAIRKEETIIEEEMGRKKIKLKRIECIIQRRSKYSKRKKGILKKAHEMATLCDVDVVLILISPTKKPTLFHSRSRSNFYIYCFFFRKV